MMSKQLIPRWRKGFELSCCIGWVELISVGKVVFVENTDAIHLVQSWKLFLDSWMFDVKSLLELCNFPFILIKEKPLISLLN